ncbi:MAG: CPBP family intramembrane glutamic endopeptidase [Candidatus Thorarchaeota archaeon]|jgi:membrane protease YdiL (CAAX protease family)
MSTQESFLSQKPIIAIIILEAFHWVSLFGSSNLVAFLGADMVSGFLLRFSIRAVLFLFIVPFILKVPNGQRTFREYLDDIGLSKFRPVGRNFILAVVSTMLLLVGLLLAALAYGNFVFDLSVIHPDNSPILLLSINAGLWEEIMWRGITVTLLLKRFSVRIAIAIDTIFFTLAHLINLFAGRDPLSMLGQLVFVLIATPFLAYIFIRTESLVPGILVHFSVDAFSPLFMYSMIQPGPNLILGGIFMLAGWLVGNVLAFIFLMTFLKYQSESDKPVIISK